MPDQSLAPPAAGHPAAGTADADSPDALKRRLRRTQRMRKLKAVGLTAPLFLFLLATFVLPIGDMLRRSVHDTELAAVWPRVAVAVAEWTDRSTVPPEHVFAALAADLRASREERTLATAARRLNYAVDNGRSLVFGTARGLPETSPDWRATLTEADPRWADPETWAAVEQASGPLTGFFLLAALDLRQAADGAIASVPPSSAIYVTVLARTFTVSIVVTGLCLLLGFPVAYLLASLPARISNLLMIFVLLPFWTSLLVRTAAWVVLLQEQGLINGAMLWLGIVDEPVRMIYNRIGVYIAMTHILLPFMILPLYSVMKGIPPHYVRAARSLGAPPATAFARVYLPLVLPGVAAGSLLVFILALGYYITPALVGGAADQMISYFIAFYTSDSLNWGMAAALGAILLTATLVLYGVFNRLLGVDRIRLG
ncbi:ABC transporter permease [Arenibaculum sp.]|jgi:putative spermidine/putrescine transport system permease protein|uniref:ABC transporter permease n=1 Tax=Arenibaculum sp. TaxID=2865862 RepID=UPI002E137878|nr:ABC transporter permease [Arenibaculum sp.]